MKRRAAGPARSLQSDKHGAMERTISRIKNLKTRRKLSLPASPSPAYSTSSIGVSGGGQPSPDSEIATSPCSSLATSPAAGSGGGRMRRGGGPSAARSGSLCVPAFSASATAGVEGRIGRHHRSLSGQSAEDESSFPLAQRTSSERATKKQWSPPVAHPHPPPSEKAPRVRQPRRASVCGVVGGGGGGGVVQHLMRYPLITTAAANPTSPIPGRYTRRSDSVSTVEEEEDEMAAIRARVLGAARQQKGRGEASHIGNIGETA